MLGFLYRKKKQKKEIHFIPTMGLKFKYKETEHIIQTIKVAGREVLNIYHNNPEVKIKKDQSVVTNADINSEKIIINELQKYNYAILSEEIADDLNRLTKEKVWIIDPLDGTRDFVDRTGEFSIMIALAEIKKPIIGVVYKPTEDKLYFAEKDNGAYLYNGKDFQKLEVSTTSEIEKATFIFSRSHFQQEEQNFIDKNNIKNIIQCGSVGLKIGLIAEKKADCYISFSSKTSQWDVCAPEIILEEAGGKVTDLRGDRFIYNREEKKNLNGILATNGALHKNIISKIEA